MKSIVANGDCQQKSNSAASPRKYNCRRASAAKIEEKLSELEKIKNRSVSSTDLTESNKKQINIPKVNIFQRREMFEKIADANDTIGSTSPSTSLPATKANRRSSDELVPVRSIKERLSSLEKRATEEESAETSQEKTKNVTLTEVSVKERLIHINEKTQQQPPQQPPQQQQRQRQQSDNVSSSSEKEKSLPLPSPAKQNGVYVHEDILRTRNIAAAEYSSGRSSSSEDYDHVQVNHFHHRSLDSLQGHVSPNGFCFERIQSLESIDCCSNYPASVLSGDTDREDSGIHTADVSSSVSQADDFDLHADASSMDVPQAAAAVATAAVDADEVKTINKSSHSEFHLISQNENASCLRDKNADVDNEDNQNDVHENNSSFNSEEFADTLIVDSSGGADDVEHFPAQEQKNEDVGNQNVANLCYTAAVSDEVDSCQNLSEHGKPHLAEKSIDDKVDNKCDSFLRSNIEEDIYRRNEQKENYVLDVTKSSIQDCKEECQGVSFPYTSFC